jgi:MFS transporter, SP family, general alpha glucoside:H+ symporter
MTDKGPSIEQIESQNEIPSDVMARAHEASQASDTEKAMTLWQGLKAYPKAVGWSILLSTALVMEGYDTALLGGLTSFPAFQKKYGHPDPSGNGEYNLTAAWQAGLSNGTSAGEVLGLFFSGYLSDIIGYRKMMLLSLSMITAFIFIPFFAPNIIVLEVGEILCGVAWGIFQTLTTAYASEVCPVVLRHYLTSYVNMCWVFGQLIAAGVVRAMLNRTDKFAYKIPFAIQWIWPVPLFIGMLFAPESPWWLVRKGRIEEAKKNLKRLTSKSDMLNIEQTLAMMIHTTEVEKAMAKKEKETSYLDCFRGVDLRRTEIVCMVWATQVLSGAYLNTIYFLEQAGLTETQAFDLGLGQNGMAIVATACSWALMSRVGRRKIYMAGLIAMGGILLIVGFLALAPATDKGPLWAQGVLLVFFVVSYDLTIGPVCYTLVAELSSTRLRQKSIVLARNTYNIIGLAASTLLPYQINQSAWDWKGKLGFFWFGSCAITFVWVYFRLPEPKGRTYAELDLLFEKKVSARKFASTEVNIYEGAELLLAQEKGIHAE